MNLMSKNKLIVPEAREALEKFKMEIANEFGVDDPRNLASKHTGLVVRELIRMGEEELIDNKKIE
jgi:small acid-soluble spore protein D (minor alpha/beta-type SASP)